MGKIESTLKEEIGRLARKEIRASTGGLQKEVIRLRKTVAQLRRQVAVLEREAGYQRRDELRRLEQLSAPEEEVKAARISDEWVKNLRAKLNVSQEELALLLGVSPSAVRTWEYGKSLPTGQRKAALVAIRKLGRREVKRLLEAMEED